MKKVARGNPNQLLKAERELRGWSQKYVADQIGADHYYLSRWEHGTSSPSPYYRSKLCLLFGKNAKELGLLHEEGEDKQEVAEEQSIIQAAPGRQIYDPAIPLPFTSGHRLIGRDEMMQQLKLRLFDSKNVVLTALNGIPGVGKTSLAVALAHDDEVRDHFRDGILWSGLGPQPNVLSLLSRWGMLLGIASAEIAKLTSIETWTMAIHHAIGERKLLIVIDDVWKIEEGLAFKVGGPRCTYIVTTRFPQLAIQFAADGATPVEELNENDSMALLAQLAPTFVASEPDEAKVLIQAVGGLPLGLMLIGKYLRSQTYSGQLRRLHTALHRLQQAETRLQLTEAQAAVERSPSLPISKPISLQNLIEVSDQQLDAQTRNTLRSLAVFPAKPNTFSEEAALAVCDEPVETLDVLMDVGLLEGRGSERYALHQTIADYARTHLTDYAAYERMVRYYADYVERHEKDYDALDQEAANIFAALQNAFQRNLHTDLIRGVNALMHFLDARGLYAQAVIYLQRAKDAAVLTNDSNGLTATLRHLGDVMIRQGNYTQAERYLQEGLALAREGKQQTHTVDVLQSLGMLAQRQGNYQQAEAYLQEGLALARSVGDHTRTSLLLKNLGTVDAIQGKYTQADVYLQEGLALARQSGDREAVSLLLLNLGQLANERGQSSEAETYLQDALALARQIGHREVISLLLTNIGVLAGEKKEYGLAEQYFQEGLTLARQIGYRERIGLLLTNLGWITAEQGNYAQAEEYYQEGIALATEIGNQWLICGTLKFLGDLQLMQKHYDVAEETFHRVLTIAGHGNQRMKGEALFGLADIAASRGDYKKARELASSSLAILESIGQGMANAVKEWLEGLPAPGEKDSFPPAS